MNHIAKNKMVKHKSSISYWVGSPIDVYIYPPPSEEEAAAHLEKVGGDPASKKARYVHNVAADALTLKLNEETYSVEPSDVQPFGLCLIVAGGAIEHEGDDIGSISKISVCKLCATIGQLGPIMGDKEKMEQARKHWAWYGKSGQRM